MTTITATAGHYTIHLDVATLAVDIARDGVWVGSGRWSVTSAEVEDCAADLGAGTWGALEDAMWDEIDELVSTRLDALRAEAVAAGDNAMADLCDRAEDGRATAIDAVFEAISNAEAAAAGE